MKIFLIGGAGYVGSAFARLFERRGDDFHILERDTYANFIGQSCDLLINANGNSVKMLGVRDPLADFDASVRTVRSTFADLKAARYIHISTCDVYPDCSRPELTLESSSPDLTRQSPYGFHKWLAEQCVRHAAPDWLIFRMGGFIGPGMRKNAIFDILQGGPLWLDPASELQFLSTGRCAEIVTDLALRTDLSGEVFNLCGRGVVRLSEVIEAAGRPVTVNPGSQRVRYEVSIDKISRYVDVPATRDAVLDFVRKSAA
jgi:nucleoside-diphosphate-sugar epimerase